jgi:crossover junction endonuclease MUS81
MQVVLDEREHALYEKCMLIAPSWPSCTITKKVLDLGDASITTSADNGTTWLMERKSVADLLASIKDGRYEEQSYRLQHAFDPRRVFYVIEGVLSVPKERKLVHATMTSLQVFKGFSVVRTSSVQETAEWLLTMSDKIHRDITQKHRVPYAAPTAVQEVSTAESYSTVVKKVKKANLTPQNMCEIILCQLPGVSHVAAQAICKMYPSLLELLDALKSDPTCLDGTTTVDAGGKTRKLGKNVHAALAQYLLFCSKAVFTEKD